MEQLALTYGTLQSNDEFISRIISQENLKEIKEVVDKTINYLTENTIIFLENINGRWYIN